MDYVVKGLDIEAFRPLFGLADDALRAHGAVRMTVDTKPGFPCRVTLEDAEPGESVLLLSWRHLDGDTPYRADGPIFVRESARATRVSRNAVPEQQRSRLLSVRAYDGAGWMRDAEVVEGAAVELLIARFFVDPKVAYLNVHNARRGCYACRIDRV